MADSTIAVGPDPRYGQVFAQQSPYALQPGYWQQPAYGPYAQAPANAFLPAAPAAQPGIGASPFAPPLVQPDSVSDPSRGFAIAGLVLGIFGIFGAILPICGLPFAILGIVFSALGRRSPSLRMMATVGLALSILAIVLALINAAAGAYLALHAHAA